MPGMEKRQRKKRKSPHLRKSVPQMRTAVESAKTARSPRPGWGGEEWRLIGCLILNVFFKNFQGSSAY